MVLTDEERSEIGWAHSASDRLFGEIEAAVIRKLAAGVSVEPCIYEGDASPLYEAPTGYTLGQLTTAIAAARVQENERCARTLEAIGCQGYADALRALLGKEQS